ncbi:ArsR/SmtB family transcription factor [Streptomyces sp. NBC_00859]|uniref:ArsR/SmtB family transcription factor n=1 Tax=Streptomyces sp. NBC_00859 TaxID=2903682 RepID=UPI003867A062|nr:helix-turn-helix domain-containing protein [Streptomyces sp. NBC_00859]
MAEPTAPQPDVPQKRIPQAPAPPLPPEPLAPDPAPDITLDAAALRVLAHPVRLSLLSRLRQYGPATARQLAAHFALDPGSASYHLRRLAAGGLIEEDPERGTRRDRWWQAVHRTSFHAPGASTPAEQADSRAYAQALLHAYSDQLRRLAGTVPLLPDDWYAASVFSDYTLHLTPDELNAMKSELVSVVGRYRKRGPTRPEHGPGGTAGEVPAPVPVSVQLQSFPLLDL